ncbi:unnamed protein product [Blepharisma stoltei]|uniref:HEAT repeat-containing protein 1 n=1 Tax=Blepharisma stoltei TaxID=1481888 RepID=A0AAU9JDU8_9CILI|nr:unnamed protein product [Blepharisma stoltei]
MTELSRQLEQLRQVTLPSGSQPSFLFDLKDASKIDRDTIFMIGMNGLEEIRRIDHTFLSFYSDVFQEDFANAHLHRDNLTKSQISKLDEELTKVIHLLAPHFLNPSCHKILELLVRFYKVHQYQRDELLSSFLPYHDTKFFTRMIMLCKLQGSQWEFMIRHQQQGYIMLRSDIVKKSMQDLSLLEVIIGKMKLSQIHMRFAGVVCLDVIHKISTLSNSLLYILLPFLSEVLSGSKEEKVLGYSLAVRISLRQNFSPHYLQALFIDILKTAGPEIEQGLATISLLMHIHKTQSLPKNIIDLFYSEEILKALANVSQKHDITQIVKAVEKKFINNLGKDKVNELTFQLCSTVNYSKAGIEAILNSLLMQYLNVKKELRDKVKSGFIKVLANLWQRYGDQVLEIIPKIVKEVCASHPGGESKTMLYDLISKGLSGMPYDPSSDLPLVLALRHPSREIRLHSLSQINSQASKYYQVLLGMLSSEDDVEILLEAVSVPELSKVDPESLYPVILKRFTQFISYEAQYTPLLRKLFTILTVEIAPHIAISSEHLKLIFLAYDKPELRDLCHNAASNAKHHQILKGYQGQDLSIYLKQWLSQHWCDIYTSVAELLDCQVILGLVPEIIEELEKKREFLTKEIISSSYLIVQKLIEMDNNATDIFEAVIRACPIARNIKSEQVRKEAVELMKCLVIYLIPRGSELCKGLLTKHFGKYSLQILLEISEKCPESLHLAVCIAANSGQFNSFLQTYPYIILSMGRDSIYRNAAIVALEQFLLKQLPKIEIEIEIEERSDFKQFEEHSSLIKKMLKRLLKYKAGISQDSNYIEHAVAKVMQNEVIDLISVGFNQVAYDRARYLSIHKKIKSDHLTEVFLEAAKSDEELAEVADRLCEYKNWGNFQHESVFLSLFEKARLRLAALKIVTPETFRNLSQELKVNLFFTLTKILPGLSSTHSIAVHELIDNLPIDASLLSQAIKNADIEKIEPLLEIVQYKHTQSSPVLIESLFSLLHKINESIQTSENEYLKQLVLLALKIHLASERKFELKGEHLNIILSSFRNEIEFNMQTKQQALHTLAGFAATKPAEVLIAMESLFMSSSKENAADEFTLFKAALRALVPSLVDTDLSVSTLVSQLINFFEVIPFDINELEDIIRIGGHTHLHLAVSYLCQTIEDLFITQEFLSRFTLEEILSSFNALISSLELEKVKKTNDFKVLDLFDLEFNAKEFLSLIPKKKEKSSQLLSEFLYSLFTLKHKSEEIIGSGDKKLISQSKSVKKQLLKLLESINRALDNETLSKSLLLILEKPEKRANIDVKKEALEFLLKRLELSNHNKFHSLIPILCAILELYTDKASALHKEKYDSKAVYLQLTILATYNLLKSYENPNQFLELYGKTILEFTKSTCSEIRSSSSLCFSVFFSAKSSDILPFIEPYLSQILNILAENDEVVIECALSCIKHMMSGARDFLSPHIEELIFKLCSIEFDTTELLSLVPTYISPRIIIVCLNSLLGWLKDNFNGLIRLLEMSKILGEKITSQDAEIYKESLFAFYKDAITLPEKLKDELDLKQVKALSSTTSDSFSSFSLSLTNQQLKPAFSEIADWCLEKAEDDDYSFHRLLTLFSITGALTDKLKSLFVSYYAYLFDVIIDTLNKIYEAYQIETKKRKRNQGKLYLEVNSIVLQCLAKLSAHDKDKFLTIDRYDKLSVSLSNQLKMVGLKNKYRKYTEANVLPAIHALITETHDQAIWQSFNYKILLNSRNENPEVRCVSLLTVNKILLTLGKEYLTLLPDIMPFVSEALEDENDSVTNIAKMLLTQLETLSGENIKEHIR